LDSYDEIGEVINMFAHRDLRRLPEVKELLLKNAEFRVAPRTVLRNKFLPCVGCRFATNDSRVRGAVRFDRIKEVVVRKTVSLIPPVDIYFVRFIWIRSPSEEPSVRSRRACSFTEIDFPGSNAGLYISGGVEQLSGNDIPEFVLNEEMLSGVHPVVEIVRIKLAERERREFGSASEYVSADISDIAIFGQIFG
jgi:hypothetical protein